MIVYVTTHGTTDDDASGGGRIELVRHDQRALRHLGDAGDEVDGNRAEGQEARARVAPAGAARLEDSVRPAAMAAGMLAVIFAPVWLVVTAQVAEASVTLVGAEPATAVVIVSDGAPTKATWLMALTAKVTVWVAVWAWADAAATSDEGKGDRGAACVLDDHLTDSPCECRGCCYTTFIGN